MTTLNNISKEPDEKFDWGSLSWLCNGKIDPEAEMTFGLAIIEPKKANPHHYHPNCEEYIFILSGTCDHSCDNEMYSLKKGDMLRVPRGTLHGAVNTGQETLKMLIVYSSPERETIGEDAETL